MSLKLEPPVNGNYAAVVKRVRSIVELPNRDKIVGVPLLGYQAIVGKDTQIGDMVVVFPPETRLSPAYLSENNLYHHASLNRDSEVTGYFEDNGRVKAVKFAGNRSDCFAASLSSLAYTGVDISQLKEDDTFDKLGDYQICEKYVRPTRASSGARAPVPTFSRVDERLFPKHFETGSYFREVHKIADDEVVYISQKAHGTSIRVGHIPVDRKLSLLERIARRLGVHVVETEYDKVYGSRNRTIDANNPTATHYEDLYSREGKKLDAVIPQGYIVFGELIGWAGPSKPIQAKYTYDIPNGETRLLVYRIAHINPQGHLVDLSWPQVKAACAEWGLEHVKELACGIHRDFSIDMFLDRRFHDDGWSDALPLGPDKKLVDEGICIRADNGFVPTILKVKSPLFLRHETAELDKAESVDLEADEASV